MTARTATERLVEDDGCGCCCGAVVKRTSEDDDEASSKRLRLLLSWRRPSLLLKVLKEVSGAAGQHSWSLCVMCGSLRCWW